MNKEFIVWDKQEREYIIDPIEYELRRLSEKETVECNFIGFKDSKRFKHLLYSGYKDIKDKKIFEGAIIKLNFKGKDFLTEIYFLNEPWFNGFYYKWEGNYYTFSKYPAEICEIVSNKFKNKD